MNDNASRDTVNAFLDNAEEISRKLGQVMAEVDQAYHALQERGDKMRQLINASSEDFSTRAREFLARMRTLDAGFDEIAQRLVGKE